MKSITLSIAAVVALAIGCGTSTKDDVTVDASEAQSGLGKPCGMAGDVGNDMGVGKYCAELSDCSGAASICAILGDPNAHFCTKTCAMGSTDACGDNATCACQGGSCGCVPNTCLN